MKYALLHEWLTPKATGGSELVVKEILQHLEADLYALIDFESTNPQSYLWGRKIGTTFLQHFPLARNGVQKYLPLLPYAIEQLDLKDYDVIISSSHAVAKGVLTRPEQLHLCYCHTPMRYAWDLTFDYLNSNPLGRGLPGVLTRYILHNLRQWDVISANRVDHFIANSQHTARRIWRCYRRHAQVIYPPVDTERFCFNPQKEDFFLTVSRLVDYKKVALIVEAFNRLQLPLVIIGDGPLRKHLEKLAQGNITLLGNQPNGVVEEYMSKAKAFVYAACEDFGIALVEAQACGTPVVAFGGGGALETVIDVRQVPDKGTGILFSEQSVEGLEQGIETFCQIGHQINLEHCRLQAMKFSPQIFATSFLAFLEESCQNRFASSSRSKNRFL